MTRRIKDMTRSIKSILIAVAAIAAIAIGIWLVQATRETTVAIGSDESIDITPEQIESIKDIGQWEFLSVADEELVDTVRRGFLSSDRLSRIYYGTMRLGVDMQAISPEWFSTSGDSIILTLPAIGLLDTDFIDEARTKSFHESGRWSGEDREALYLRARQKMTQHGLTPENIRFAQQNGETQVRHMMQSLGYRHVSIRWQEQLP